MRSKKKKIMKRWRLVCPCATDACYGKRDKKTECCLFPWKREKEGRRRQAPNFGNVRIGAIGSLSACCTVRGVAQSEFGFSIVRRWRGTPNHWTSREFGGKCTTVLFHIATSSQQWLSFGSSIIWRVPKGVNETESEEKIRDTASVETITLIGSRCASRAITSNDRKSLSANTTNGSCTTIDESEFCIQCKQKENQPKHLRWLCHCVGSPTLLITMRAWRQSFFFLSLWWFLPCADTTSFADWPNHANKRRKKSPIASQCREEERNVECGTPCVSRCRPQKCDVPTAGDAGSITARSQFDSFYRMRITVRCGSPCVDTSKPHRLFVVFFPVCRLRMECSLQNRRERNWYEPRNKSLLFICVCFFGRREMIPSLCFPSEPK